MKKKIKLNQKLKLFIYFLKKELYTKYRKWQAKRHFLKYHKYNVLAMEHYHEFIQWELPTLKDTERNKYLVTCDTRRQANQNIL